MKYINEQLLNTQEAARFLRVSQASIRRWSNSGLLTSRRVGRRRERRFREADLLEFMEHRTPEVGEATHVNVRGISVPVPGHLAPLFSTDEGGLRLCIPFLAEGLRLGQPIFLVASGDVLARYRDALSKQPGVDLAAAARRDLFEVVDFKAGTALAAIAQWEDKFAHALAKNTTLIRIVGEMACEREMFNSEDEMLSYEEAFEVMHHRYPVVVLCQYDVRRFDGMALLRALRAHPDIYGVPIGALLN